MIYILIAIHLVLVSPSLSSQPTREWVARFDGVSGSYDIVSEMGLDNSGNVYAYGSSNDNTTLYDFAIVKYDNSGNEVWRRIYDGPGNSTDQILSGVTDTTGNSFVTGFITDTTGKSLITTAKYNSSGDLIWMKVYRGFAYTIGSGKNIIMDGSGNTAVCAYILNSSGDLDIAVLKYSNEGVEINSVIYSGPGSGDDLPSLIKTDDQGNIIIAGSTSVLNEEENILVLKYDSSLNLGWQKTYNGSANSNDWASSLAVGNDNSIFLCGSMSNAGVSFDYFYAKIDPSGSTVWQGVYNGVNSQRDIPYSTTQDEHGNIIITGHSARTSSAGSEDILTIKLSPSGSLLWERVFNGSANGTDQAFDIETDEQGNMYIGGGTDRGNAQLIYALLKYDPSGNLIWLQEYGVATEPEDFIYNLLLDSNNNIYVTGIGIGIGSEFDFVTIKYSQTTNIISQSETIPTRHKLFQNYPNPFNPNTVIEYELTGNERVKIILYDISGKEIRILTEGVQSAGRYSVDFNGEKLPSGVYYYKLAAGEFVSVKKLALIK